MLSVIIPTKNEAEHLPNTLRALREYATANQSLEIIVVDTGSSDNTVKLARELGVRVIECPDATPGRASPLNTGARESSADVLLFLDADSIVPMGYDAHIFETLADKAIVAGAFEFKLDGPEFGLRVVEWINRTRYRIWKRYYGDQGLFVRRDIFHKAGGFPAVRLMESSDLCIKLAKFGRLKLIGLPMRTSPRRFIDYGIYHVLWFDIRMWWLNLWGHDVGTFAEHYWSTHEAQNKKSIKV